MPRRWWVILVALVAWTQPGCVSKPVLELHGAAVRTAMPQGVGLDIFIKVNNDNVFDVQIRNVRANVRIAEKYALPPIQYSPNQWLRSQASTVVRVPVVVPWPIIPSLLRTTVGSKSIDYRVRGTVDVTAVRSLGIRRNDHPVDEEGTVSRRQLVMAAGRGLRF